MKRVLCILSSLDTGGAETFMMKIFRALPDMYKLDFIVSADRGYYEKEVLKLGGKIFRVPLRTKHPVKTFFDIKRIVRDNKYDVVLKLCDTPIAIYDVIAAKIGGAKKICVRSCNAAANISKKSEVICRIIRPLFNYLTNVKLAPSKMAADYTFGSNAKVNILHNAIDLQHYKFSAEARNRIRLEFEIDDDCMVLGHVGRFSYQKNHQFLINIFEEFVKMYDNCKLILVGDGELKEQIYEKVKNSDFCAKVIFAGIRDDISDLLSAMDIFLLPSYYEGLPNTIIEAQATGLPCLIADTITHEVNITGIVEYMPLNNPRDWAQRCIQKTCYERTQYIEDIINSGYEISHSVKEFIDLVF